MNRKKYITVTGDSCDHLITKYLETLKRIMDLEIELFEI